MEGHAPIHPSRAKAALIGGTAVGIVFEDAVERVGIGDKNPAIIGAVGILIDSNARAPS